MKKISLLTILLVGLITACAPQPTTMPASPPTDQPAPTTQAVISTDTALPTETVINPTSTTQPITDTPAVQAATVSFANDILPLFQNRCKNCHGGNKTEEDLNLLSYAAIMKGSKNGLVVVPGDANNSLLAELLLNQKMPKRGPKLTPDQTQLIIDWINAGALDN